MDEVDRANQDAEFLSNLVKPNLKQEAEATGFCLFCGEPILDPNNKNRRWCDAFCRDHWEKEQKKLVRK